MFALECGHTPTYVSHREPLAKTIERGFIPDEHPRQLHGSYGMRRFEFDVACRAALHTKLRRAAKVEHVVGGAMGLG